MLARHPYFTAAAAVYLAGIFAISLAPGASLRLGFWGGLFLLLPAGVFLAIWLGKSKMATSILLGVSICLWLELGRTAWFGTRDSAFTDVTANIVGVVLGVALTCTFSAITERSQRRKRTSLSPVSQKRR
ncbi:MAG: hypothetical protein ACOH1J_06695 [Microbacteriaceae bacterium]